MKSLQIELWHNCLNNCAFCYLKKNRILYNDADKLAALEKAEGIIHTHLGDYDTVGLIGGDFFQDQLQDQNVLVRFLDLIDHINFLLQSGKLEQFWLASSLLKVDKNILTEVLDRFTPGKPIILCTSYDSENRFRYEAELEEWFSTLDYIKTKYPHITLHLQTILTQHFISSVLENNIDFERLLKYGHIDYKMPAPFKVNRGLPRNIRLDADMPPDFPVRDRANFMAFMLKMGRGFLKDFTNNTSRAEKQVSIPTGRVYTSRWDERGEENAACGHPKDSYCYSDSKACARCDALALLKDLGE